MCVCVCVECVCVVSRHELVRCHPFHNLLARNETPVYRNSGSRSYVRSLTLTRDAEHVPSQAGSGIEHAEGGGTPKGVIGHGFQIWINVPSSQKMSVPAYGTVPTQDIPVHESPTGATVRVIAGDFSTVDGDAGTLKCIHRLQFKIAETRFVGGLYHDIIVLGV